MGGGKKIVTIPTFLYKMAARNTLKQHIKDNLDRDCILWSLQLQCSSNSSINLWAVPLGVTDDDIDAAIGQSCN